MFEGLLPSPILFRCYNIHRRDNILGKTGIRNLISLKYLTHSLTMGLLRYQCRNTLGLTRRGATELTSCSFGILSGKGLLSSFSRSLFPSSSQNLYRLKRKRGEKQGQSGVWGIVEHDIIIRRGYTVNGIQASE